MLDTSEEQKHLIREAIGTIFSPSYHRPFVAFTRHEHKDGRLVEVRYAVDPFTSAFQRAIKKPKAGGEWKVSLEYDPYRHRFFDTRRWSAPGTAGPVANLGIPEGLILPYKGNFWGREGDFYRIDSATRTPSGYTLNLTPQVKGKSRAHLEIDGNIEKIVKYTDSETTIYLSYEATSQYSPLPTPE